MRLKVGDVLVEVERGGKRRERTVAKVGRVWAQALGCRVAVEPNADGTYTIDNHGFGASRRAYLGHHALDVSLWKTSAINAVRKAVDWQSNKTFSVETLEAALVLFGIEHEPAPKVAP